MNLDVKKYNVCQKLQYMSKIENIVKNYNKLI